MKCFMQGMRRSGTTIIYDVLSQDERLDLWYEPLSLGRVGALGGGSGMQEVDLMAKIRRAREDFLKGYGDRSLTNESLNWGAPTAPKLEIKKRLPRHVRAYLEYLLAQSEHTVCKFTRAYRKVKDLKKLRSDARFVHLLRHPMAVVTSYLYGKDQKHQARFAEPDAFFTHRSKANPWNSYKLLRRIAKEERRPELLERPDFERYLALWKFTCDHTFRDGRKHFGEAFTVLRHEDLGRDPEGEVRRVYAHLGLPASEAAVAWAKQNVQVRHKPCFDEDPRWAEAFDRLGLTETLEQVGYGLTAQQETAARSAS